MNEKLLIFFTILIAILLITFGIYFQSKNISEDIDPIVKTFKKVDQSLEFVIGNQDPKIYIIEYSDLECPGCKKYNDNVSEKLIKKWSNKVGFVFRHMPLKKHPSALFEAVNVECAGKIGGIDKFKVFKEKIFSETKSNGNFSKERLSSIANEIGLDIGKFQSCLKNKDIEEKIQASYNEAVSSGIKITPTIFALFKNGEVKQLTPDFKVIDTALKSFFSE